MDNRIGLALRIVLVGIGATLFMDIWAIAADTLFGIPQSNFAVVGRWLGHMMDGEFVHQSIRKAAPIAGESSIGWTAHYLTGIALVAAFIAISGTRQLQKPMFVYALLFGVVTVVFPFFVLQPALGAGIMASNRPDPNFARLKSLMTHFSFGLGLYLALWVQAKAFKPFAKPLSSAS
ncbi:DUF2938 family protein [Pseudovibrio sp. Tun.PSC04-5.I4]|uniref:DUF2938 family protein n=1 Tax=Pseudovibrio sp. Tun.PSC04-5.I4 TaxID=1798213 RepID=UPI00088B824D|nr:DUF2938 family protein [Pseudovibrio sp. Tun.PSC04-5.I4]SDQ33518.1 Protein of unknown function [Pseudovibrio sp. Tun.PSC04-5.I4]